MLGDELPAEVEVAIAPVLALVKAEVEAAVKLSPWLQAIDRKGIAWARAHGYGDYGSGANRAMANVLGGPEALLALRQLRAGTFADAPRSEQVTYGEDARGRTELEYRDADDLREAENLAARTRYATPTAPPMVERSDECNCGESDCDICGCDCNEDDCDTCHGEDRCDHNGCSRCHSPYACCGCCEECECVHTSDRNSYYTREVGDRFYCRDCDHECYEDEVSD